MFHLENNPERGTITISFDSMLSLHPLGPFADIVIEYAAETGLRPQTLDRFFGYKFTENDSSVQFYWNGGFTVYAINIGKAGFWDVRDRLSRICARISRRLKNAPK